MQEKTVTITPYIQLARVPHWIKNILVFPGLFLAVMMELPLPSGFVYKLLLGTIAICFTSSANYVINEWLDAPYDKFHPLKKNRPSVTGNLSRAYVYFEYALLAICGVLLATQVNSLFLVNLVWLLLMGVVYNVEPLRSKDMVFGDVLSESVNNVIRFMLGWALVTADYLPSSSVLFSYWMGGAFLMAVKRLAEYRFIGNPEVAGLYRRSFRQYSEGKLLASILFYAMMSLFFWGIFIIKYKIELLVSVPFFALLFCIYLELGLRPNSVAQRPEALYKEKWLLSYCLFLVLLVTALFFVHSDILKQLLRTELIPIQ